MYAIAVVLLLAIASLFVYLYQTHRERSAYVTIVCIFTITCLLATVLLLPVDVALVSSTTSSKLGRRKEWATQDKVDNITKTLRIVYYLLYSLDAVLCLLVIPFTYFWYEEGDEVAQEEGSQTFASRFWAAAKYTIVFVLLCVAIFLVGFFVPCCQTPQRSPFWPGFLQKSTIGESRRASIDFRSWSTHHYRHHHLLLLHRSRTCSPAPHADQDRPKYFSTSTQPVQHCSA